MKRLITYSVLFFIKCYNWVLGHLRNYIFVGQYTTNRNYGDALGYRLPILLGINEGNILSKRRVFLKQYARGINLQMVGSTIGDVDTNSVLCGAGAISEDQRVQGKPLKVLSVRGPLTRQVLEKQEIDCPSIYGDPAMLLPLFYRPQKHVHEHKIGLIPHYMDHETAAVKRLSCFEEVHLMNILLPRSGWGKMSIEHYWKKWIDELCSCSIIISSSLHGLIIAEAYGIPTVWAKFSNSIDGGDFKFRDYYASIGITPPSR